MTKFVLGALALTAASTPCLAGNEDWLNLDRDIESLASSLTQAPAGGATVSGFLRTSYANSGDVQDASGNDLGGFSIDNARLQVQGSVGDYGVLIQLEGSDDVGFGILGYTGSPGTVQVLDAYATFAITEQIKGQMGNFRPPFLASSLREENNLLFMDRTIEGDTWAFRDQGVQVSGAFEMFGIWLAAQNGDDSAGDELALSARAQFTPMGAAPGAVEGAYGAGDSTNLTIGAGYYNYEDDVIKNGTAFCVDASFVMGALSAAAEMVDYDKDIGDNTPWNAQVGFMFVPDQWEAAVRYEDADDVDNSNAITVGVNWYQSGHAAKWVADYSMISSDDDNLERDVLQIGLTVSI